MSAERRERGLLAACLVAVAAGFVFGGADQYLGSRIALGPWASSVSAMSAPWLLLAVRVRDDAAQASAARWRSVWLVTLAALAGYFALTLSPLGRRPARATPDRARGAA